MAMPRIPGWFFIPTVVAIGTVATFSLLYIGGLPQLWPPPKFDYSQLKSEVAQEWRYATTDHEGIAHAIAACNKISDLRSQPDYILSQLRIGVAPDGTYASMSDGGKSGEEYKFTNFQRAVIYLSDAIRRARYVAATTVTENHSNMAKFEVAIVVIGAITTVLISIKALATANEEWLFWLGIAAIIFSAAGTATSALNSYFKPNELYTSSVKSLANLRQLHTEIAVGVMGISNPDNCPKIDLNQKNDENRKQLQDWSTRFAAIINPSEPPSSLAPGGANVTSVKASAHDVGAPEGGGAAGEIVSDVGIKANTGSGATGANTKQGKK